MYIPSSYFYLLFCIIVSLAMHSLLYFINPLVADPLYLVSMAKNSILKKEGINEKNSCERRAYESVDDRSHS